MAVDTKNKRFSMLNFADGTSVYGPMFDTDGASGSVSLDDRQHLLDLYGGIAFAAPAGGRIVNLVGLGGLVGPGIVVGEGGMIA